jgi:precorrin-6B methylase 1
MNGTNNKSKGKVYICGAGPGNPDLITKKCWDLLKHCDIILYDRLVGKGILELIPESTPKIYVGRAAGDPTSNQLKTNKVMLQYVLEGKNVLKSFQESLLQLAQQSVQVFPLLIGNFPHQLQLLRDMKILLKRRKVLDGIN